MNRDALVLTTDTLPPHLELIEVYGLVEATSIIEISQKGMIRQLIERRRDDHEEAVEHFISIAPPDTNVIYGVRVSTATMTFSDGSYLYLTYCGTAAMCRERQVAEDQSDSTKISVPQ
jgi:hypothetical protein